MKKSLLFLTLIVLLSGCTKGKPKREAHPQIPEQAIEKFSVKETKDGKVNWELESTSAQINDLKKVAILKAPRIKFYQMGKQVSVLVADRGRINTENYDIWGESNCVVTTAKGEILETKNLRYISSTQKIVTDERVKLTRPDEVITGIGMEATPDLESIIIKNQKVEFKNK